MLKDGGGSNRCQQQKSLAQLFVEYGDTVISAKQQTRENRAKVVNPSASEFFDPSKFPDLDGEETQASIPSFGNN